MKCVLVIYACILQIATFLSTCWCQYLHGKSGDNIWPISLFTKGIKINHVATVIYLRTWSIFVVCAKIFDKVRLSAAPVLYKLSHPGSKQRPVHFMDKYAQGLVNTQLILL